jgi:hypothetical protein
MEQNNQQKQITVLATIHNVKVAVPGAKAHWRVGTFDMITNDVKKFGEGMPAIQQGLAYQTGGPSENIFFVNGLVVQGGTDRVILNRTFWNLSCADFGQTLNFKMEIKEEKIGDKTYTSVSFTKENGYWKKGLKFALDGKTDATNDGQKDWPILGTNAKIIATSLPEPTINVREFFPTKQISEAIPAN